MRTIFVMILSVMFAIAMNVSAQNIDSYRNRLLPEVFKNSVVKKHNKTQKYIDSLQIATGEKYIIDSRYPISNIYERSHYVIAYIMSHNRNILNPNFAGDMFVGTSLDVLIMRNSKILGTIEITMDLLFTKFPDASHELKKYDIHAVENIGVEDNYVVFDIMICIPDTDMDQYFRIKCSGNNIIEITNISNEYWKKYDTDDY